MFEKRKTGSFLTSILLIFAFALSSQSVAREHADTLTLDYILPVSYQTPLKDIQSSEQWKRSPDGWVRQNITEWDYWVGETPKVAWLKVTFHQEVLEPQWIELASSGISRAKLFFYDQQRWESIDTDKNPSEIRSRFLSFEIPPEWTEQTLYIRVESTTKFHLQFNVKSREEFISGHAQSNAIFFVCYGILLVMVLYNLVLGKFLQDRLYYIYSAAIATTLAYQFFAHGHSRLFYYFDMDYVNHFLNVFAMLSSVSALIFLYYFSNIKRYLPKLAKFFRLFIRLFFVASILVILLPTNASINVTLMMAAPTPIFGMLFALFCWHAGSKTAGIFVVAWTFYIIGGFLWVIYWLGLVTLNNWVEIPLIAGAALESILLSLALGYRIQRLQKQRSQLKKSELYYKTISLMDPLTNLANRRAFNNRLEELKEHGVIYSLVLLDIDNFKLFNDTHGHLSGDKVLETMGEILRNAVRELDLAARIGGEEFALIILSESIDVVYGISERIRLQFSHSPFEGEGGAVFCSVSIGVSVIEPEEMIEPLMERTDKALYKAKENGRNQTQLSTSTSK